MENPKCNRAGKPLNKLKILKKLNTKQTKMHKTDKQ